MYQFFIYFCAVKHSYKAMVKKSTLESILQQEMSDFWALLENEEKRIIAENFKK